MKNKKILIVLGIILVIFSSIYLINNYFPYLKYFQSYITSKQLNCQVDNDCVLVQSAYCKNIQAVNQAYKETWTKQNLKSFEAEMKKEKKMSCPLTVKEYTEMNNFKAFCDEGMCDAQYILSE